VIKGIVHLVFAALGSAMMLLPDANAASVEVTSYFADIPAGAEVPATIETLAKAKSVTLLSSPKIVVEENALGKVEVTQPTQVPGGGHVSLGVSLAIKTSITEKGNVWFSGQITDRSHGGGEKNEKLQTAGFVVREWFFSGYAASGETVLVRTTPATSQAVKDGKKVTSTRELVVYLAFKKLSAAAKPPQAKKPATSTIKKTERTSGSSTKKPSTGSTRKPGRS
jgi:hypothetical protein